MAYMLKTVVQETKLKEDTVFVRIFDGKASGMYGGSGGGGTQFDLMGQYIGEFNEIGNLTDWSLMK